MPEQITPLLILYLLLHGAGTAVAAVLFLYLLLCRGKAIAPDITRPHGCAAGLRPYSASWPWFTSGGYCSTRTRTTPAR